MLIFVKVSVWPQVNNESTNFSEMYSKGYLVKNDKGQQVPFDAPQYYYDPFNADARKFVFDRLVAGYVSHGINVRNTQPQPLPSPPALTLLIMQLF